MNRQMAKFHLFYAIAPVLAYYAVTMLVVFACSLLSLDNVILNSINIVINLIFLYAIFYRPYQKIQLKDRMPGLLPKAGLSKAVRLPKWAYVLIIAAGISASIAVNNWFILLRLPEKITTYKEVAKSIYSGNFVIMFLRAAVGAAIVEELLMRGLFYSGLSQVIGRIAGTLCSAFVFGVIHGNLLQGMYAFLLGVLFCFVYDMFGRDLKAAVLTHMSANCVSVLATMVPAVAKLRTKYFITQTLLFSVLLAGSLFAIYRCRAVRIKGLQIHESV